MGDNTGSKNIVIDFTELDATLEVLVLSIGDFFNKKNGNITDKQEAKNKPEKPKIKKKLNVDLIKQMVLETRQIQEKSKQNKKCEKSQTLKEDYKK